MSTEIQYGGLLWGFVRKFPLIPSFLSRGNRRLITLYILLFSLLLIFFYLGGLVMRGVNALTTADYLNQFSNSSPSLIRVARDWHVLWPDLGLALASLYPDSARDPAGDLWRYPVTQGSLIFSLIKPIIGLGGIFTRGNRNSVIRSLSTIK